jgi:hypothetical protein
LTVKTTALLVPVDVVTLMFWAPVAALEAITSEAEICVAVTAGLAPMLKPDGRFRVAPVRFVPVMVTGTVVPWMPDAGEMEASVGSGGVTVKVTALLVPSGVVTVML